LTKRIKAGKLRKCSGPAGAIAFGCQKRLVVNGGVLWYSCRPIVGRVRMGHMQYERF